MLALLLLLLLFTIVCNLSCDCPCIQGIPHDLNLGRHPKDYDNDTTARAPDGHREGGVPHDWKLYNHLKSTGVQAKRYVTTD